MRAEAQVAMTILVSFVVFTFIRFMTLPAMTEQWTVSATREGLVGGTTASGMTIKASSIFVALPHRNALGKLVGVTYNETTITCRVEDVGPWSTRDDYWAHNTRPLAESGKRDPNTGAFKRKPTNTAGIDLSDGLWDSLKIPRDAGVVQVTWRWAE